MGIYADFCKVIDSIIEKIKRHPFLQQLQSGVLDKEIFHFYLQQDAVYLKAFRQAHTLISERTNQTEIKLKLASLAKSVVLEAEQLGKR